MAIENWNCKTRELLNLSNMAQRVYLTHRYRSPLKNVMETFFIFKHLWMWFMGSCDHFTSSENCLFCLDRERDRVFLTGQKKKNNFTITANKLQQTKARSLKILQVQLQFMHLAQFSVKICKSQLQFFFPASGSWNRTSTLGDCSHRTRNGDEEEIRLQIKQWRRTQ